MWMWYGSETTEHHDGGFLDGVDDRCHLPAAHIFHGHFHIRLPNGSWGESAWKFQADSA